MIFNVSEDHFVELFCEDYFVVLFVRVYSSNNYQRKYRQTRCSFPEGRRFLPRMLWYGR